MILTVTFIAVGVKRLPLWHWLIVITIYCLVDNYLSYGQLDVTHLRLQLGTMLVLSVWSELVALMLIVGL